MCVNYHQNQKNDLESLIQVLQIESRIYFFFLGKRQNRQKEEIKNGENEVYRTRLLACTQRYPKQQRR
jgi:hypothetical protein